MTKAKIAFTIPADLLMLAKKEVRAGRAKSLSGFISEAVNEKVQRNELKSVLDAMDAEYGPPNKAARTWAKRILRRSS